MLNAHAIRCGFPSPLGEFISHTIEPCVTNKKVVNEFPSPLGEFISHTVSTTEYRCFRSRVSIPSRGIHFSYVSTKSVILQQTTVSIPSRGIHFSYQWQARRDAAAEKFPSPLGEFISHTNARSASSTPSVTFPSPLGEFISHTKMKKYWFAVEMNEFPSPLGEFISHTG